MTKYSAASLACLAPEQVKEVLSGLSPAQLDHLRYDWQFWGRPQQQEPPGAWDTWLILAGRGYGKTRTGAEWIRHCASGKTPLAKGKYRRLA